MDDDEHATHAALRSSKTGVRDSLGSTIVPPPPSDSASDRSSYDEDLDEDLSAVDGDEGRTMEDEDPEPAFEAIERGPLADFDDDELRGILARADLDAEDDGEDLLDEDDVNDEDDDEEDLGEGAARRAPMSTSAALAALKSTRPRTARAPAAAAAADAGHDAASKKKKPPNPEPRSSGQTSRRRRGSRTSPPFATVEAREHRELAPRWTTDPTSSPPRDGTRKRRVRVRRARRRPRGDASSGCETVNELGVHVVNIRGEDEYVRELGRLMDGAERDIVALKEAQRSAFDALQKEEKELARYVDDFAATGRSLLGRGRLARARRRHRRPQRQGPAQDLRHQATVSAGTVLRGAPRDEPWTVRRRRVFQPTRRGEERFARFPIPAPTSPSSSAEARDREGPGRSVARGVATTSARRTPVAAARFATATAAADRRNAPPAVTEYERYMSDYGPTGGWADVDPPLAPVPRAVQHELRQRGGPRRRGVRPSTSNARRLSDRPVGRRTEELHEARKAAVARWREEQREAERASARRSTTRCAREVGAGGARGALAGWRESETRGVAGEETSGGGGGRGGAARGGTPRPPRAPRLRASRRRSARSARRATRLERRRGGKLRRLREPPRRRRPRL